MSGSLLANRGRRRVLAPSPAYNADPSDRNSRSVITPIARRPPGRQRSISASLRRWRGRLSAGLGRDARAGRELDVADPSRLTRRLGDTELARDVLQRPGLGTQFSRSLLFDELAPVAHGSIMSRGCHGGTFGGLEGSLPMDRSLVETAAALAASDGEFRLNAGGWTGALVLDDARSRAGSCPSSTAPLARRSPTRRLRRPTRSSSAARPRRGRPCCPRRLRPATPTPSPPPGSAR